MCSDIGAFTNIKKINNRDVCGQNKCGFRKYIVQVDIFPVKIKDLFLKRVNREQAFQIMLTKKNHPLILLSSLSFLFRSRI